MHQCRLSARLRVQRVSGVISRFRWADRRSLDGETASARTSHPCTRLDVDRVHIKWGTSPAQALPPIEGCHRVGSSNLASPTKPSTPSDLVGPAFQPTFLPPLISPSDGRSGRATDHQAENAVQTSSMACTSGCRSSRDRRILMAGDPLQDMQFDAGVGHPCLGDM